MDYQMLVLDIDGTLTNSKKEITRETKEAILDIQKKGYKVVLASGRPTPGIEAIAEQLELERYGNYILSFNGAKIINCATKEVIYQKVLPDGVIPLLYEEAVQNGVGIITYEGESIIAGTPIDSYMEIESRINGIPIREVNNFAEYVNFDVNKCLMTGEPEHLERLEKKLKDKFNGALSIYRSEPFFLEIMPSNVDKAQTLLKLLSALGLTSEQMICCGDGFNDISMIECAGLGVAMENAQDLVKAACDYITLSNDNNGILHVIHKFILKDI
ncbi:MAG: HAD family phosphatase [Lachnospiraceae bacterium]|nr:HAD family phosphatase [Lachnospiraceae bacterium]